MSDDERPIDEPWGPIATDEELNHWLERVGSGLREALWMPDQRPSGLEIESMEFEGEYPDIAVVIIFRESRRPGCRFGYRWPHLGEIAASKYPYNPDTVIFTNFQSARSLRLPEDCDPNEITWLDEPADEYRAQF